jgi:hypothetical protein
MASIIPPPHVTFASGSSSLLDVPRPGAPIPSHPPPSPSRFLFWCFAVFFFLSVSVFFEFFCSSCRSFPRQFRCPPSIVELHSRPQCNELPSCSSLYGVNVHAIGFFPCISFCLYSVMLLFFSLYFICYLLVIMLWPRWFDWILFDSDLCVVYVYVTLAFESRRKNGPDFYVVNECVS